MSTFVSMYNWSWLYLKWESIKLLTLPENLQNILESYGNEENYFQCKFLNSSADVFTAKLFI